MKYVFFIFFFFLPLSINAQADAVKGPDSSAIKPHINWLQTRYVQESKVPLALALASLTIMAVPDLKVNLQHHLMWNDQSKPGYINLGDDYVRYAPAVAAYALSFCGLKSQHRFVDRSVILAVSYIASDFVVHNTKNLTKETRPDGGTADYSFPSQHTAMAFVAATFLDHELGYISPWISVGGYAAASYVGYCRIARNAHWTNDVLMGAAVGMIVTNATYWAYDGIMKKFSTKLTIAPTIAPQQTGVYVCYRF